MGIKGVLPKERLDPEYISEMPSFWITNSRRTIKLADGTTLSVGGEYKKSVFNRILREISRAGDRLHKMNREKHVQTIKKQTEHLVESLQSMRQVETPLRERTFKI
jgi:hypothetical protein